MHYLLSKDFTQIAETSGTIQNTSKIYSVEISDNTQAGSGLILPPLDKFSFANKTLYARCHEVAAVELRVVPFIATSGGSSSGSSSDDISPENYDDPINDMWNNTSAGSTNPNFDQDIDDIYGN